LTIKPVDEYFHIIEVVNFTHAQTEEITVKERRDFIWLAVTNRIDYVFKAGTLYWFYLNPNVAILYDEAGEQEVEGK